MRFSDRVCVAEHTFECGDFDTEATHVKTRREHDGVGSRTYSLRELPRGAQAYNLRGGIRNDGCCGGASEDLRSLELPSSRRPEQKKRNDHNLSVENQVESGINVHGAAFAVTSLRAALPGEVFAVPHSG